METEQPIILKIEKVVDEARDTRTFVFNYDLGAKPGQFVNVWIPGINEKPFSISFQDRSRFAVTCFAVGDFSRKLNTLMLGEKVGIRGPYGKGFTLKRGKVALVGGGCGAAPMAFLAEELKKIGAEVDFIVGARSKDCLLYLERMKLSSQNIEVHAVTDDGSLGFKGFSTQILESLMQKKRYDFVYTCGPEIMMKKVIDICDKYNVGCEVSMERYMKCGFGVCGQCCIDNLGIRVCKEGPVFNKETVKQMFEFNKYKRDATGKKMPFAPVAAAR